MTEHLEEQNPNFATFWSRAGAYILDGFIVGTFIFIVNLINIANFKSFLLYLIVTLIGILYKPYMESKYMATFGKMALKLKVTDHKLNQIDFKQSLLRSLILIIPSILLIPFYYFAFNNPSLMEITGLLEFAKGMALHYPFQNLISYLSFIIITIDIIFLLSDSTKTQRSLHDRIGKTYVITYS